MILVAGDTGVIPTVDASIISGGGAVAVAEEEPSLEVSTPSFDDNLNRVVQKMQSSNENLDAKINALNQTVAEMRIDIGALRSDIGVLKKMMGDQGKQKTLEGALTLLDLNSFIYCQFDKYGGDGYQYKSSELAKKVIRLFMIGRGINLPQQTYLMAITNGKYFNSKTNTEKELLNKAFLDKFVEQIKELIRREPRLVKHDNGVYTIYYE